MRRLGYSKHLGNKAKKEVHDLDKEKPQCQINEIIAAGHAVSFITLEQAHREGFDNCAFCIGCSRR